MNEKIRRFFGIAKRIENGLDVPDEDLQFYMSYAPDIDKSAIQKFLASPNGQGLSEQDVNAAFAAASQQLQSNPIYKEKLVDIAISKKGQELGDKINQGVNLLLAGSDIANSISQISKSNQGLKRTSRPQRPVTPVRDQYLAQALRSANESIGETSRALAPIEAQIQDQYQSDLANARTASTGNAGSFGSFAQVAANRRNRAAMQLAPIADGIRRENQARYDNLLGMRQQETQQMFQNQAQLYPHDLQQYNADVNAAASLGAQGRENLRNSLYNLGAQAGPTAAEFYRQRKMRNLRNQATAAGLDPDLVERTNVQLEQNYAPMRQEDINSQYGGYGDYYRYNS